MNLGQQVQPQEPIDPKIQEWALANPEIAQQVQGNPELLRQMYQDYAGQEAIASDQMALANQVRQQESPQGRQAGGQFVAANPLEHIADAGQKVMAAHQMKKGMDAREKLSADKTAGLGSIAKGKAKQMEQQQALMKQKEQAELLKQMQANQGMSMGA